MAQAEENYLIRETVHRARVVTFIALEKKPQIEKIKEPKSLKRQRMREPLTRKQIIHLHKALGHAHPDKIKEMVKKTRMWDEKTITAIEDLTQCKVCV